MSIKSSRAVLTALAAALAVFASVSRPARAEIIQIGQEETGGSLFSDTFRITADRMAADRNTEAMFATGHVVAVSHPTRLLSDYLERGTNGVCHLADPTHVTTCTNDTDHLHWQVEGEVEYRDGDYVLLRNAWLKMWNVPVFWLPYAYYPMQGQWDFRIMPGYTSRWGAYLMMAYGYKICGTGCEGDGTFWLKGKTRLDLRWEQGIAIGEDLTWQLGNWGNGQFKIYYAWDQSVDKNYGDGSLVSGDGYDYRRWGSAVPENRYIMEFRHALDATERDRVRFYGSIASDTFMRQDFLRHELLMIRNEFGGSRGNEAAWEHAEDLWGFGVSVSGPINDFETGVCRLPEIYFDVSPVALWDTSLAYETENRLGYLKRRAAHYAGTDPTSVWCYNPGVWADYETVRFDTYHRLSGSWRAWDVLAISPRLGYHGTFWNSTGLTDLTGQKDASNEGNAFRSIFEAGVTFAGRGSAWINDDWQHVLEPYLDVLAQEAWYANLGDGTRPYVFDSIDASCDWSDQFAGRSRNLPYSYYGVTPGIRNAFRRADEFGNLRKYFDVDVYVALQANHADWDGLDEERRLTEPGKPNYGESGMVVPGGRIRWTPDEDVALLGRIEWDCENAKIALAELVWQHRLWKGFSYNISYTGRDARWWDFSTAPYSRDDAAEDDFNFTRYSYVRVGFEHEVCDAFAYAPYVRWDCRYGELDEVGCWIDVYRTDCLGFRINLAYENEFTRVDGSTYDAEWTIGFYIYLRALGPGAALGASN